MRKRFSKLATVLVATVLLGILPAKASAQLITLTEGFESGAAMTLAGWFIQNNSSPIGSNTNGWNQVQASGFPAQAGPADSNMIANFNAGGGLATISAWLLTPELSFSAATTLTFYTRSTGSSFPDRMQVRLSTTGASTNVGTLATDTGDFANLLLDINPTYVAANYPSTYTQFVVNIPIQAGSGRLAFRYFVENGGPSGANSDLIGLDTLTFAPVPEPGSMMLTGAAIGLAGFIRKRRNARKA